MIKLICILAILILIIIIIIYFTFIRKTTKPSPIPSPIQKPILLNEGDIIFSESTDQTQFSSKIYSQNKKYFTAIEPDGIWGIYDSYENRIKGISDSIEAVKYQSGALCTYNGKQLLGKTNTKIDGKALLLMNNNGILQLLDTSSREQWNSNAKPTLV